MRIHKLRLYNFGLFRGQAEFDFLPREKYGKTRPIVLIGGKNGAGKTTILEAIRLCLYGPSMLGSRVSGREYDEYLRARVHRDDNALVMNFSSSVALEFEYSELGQNHLYAVERSWDVDAKRVKLNLSVTRDGAPIDDLDHAHADDFLRDLIPPGVSQLYFFDGEKIQQLAESENDDNAISEAVRSLLGLDLAERLGSDLQIYASRLQRSENAASLEQDLEAIDRELSEKNDNLLKLRTKLDEAESNLKAISTRIASTEGRISKEGGAFADVRSKLEDERKRLRLSIDSTENAIRQLAEGLFPFALAKNLCRNLITQIHDEETLASWQTTSKLIENRIKKLLELAKHDLQKISALAPELRTEVLARFETLAEQVSDRPDNLPDAKMIHRLSTDQSEKIVRGAQTALEQVPKEARQLSADLERLTRELQKTEVALSKAPTDDQMRPLVARINDLHHELGGADADHRRVQQEYAAAEIALKELRGRRGKLVLKKDELERGSERERMVARVTSALEEYVTSLTAKKSSELEEAVRNRFKQLWRKGDVVRRIEIDPTTFSVSLYDRHGRTVQKKELSAGEKQIYAISMLWGLAEVSRRPLPMVIDTPLGRLDSDHRTHLVNHYFPTASHQVIILSTDTEIDEKYFDDLKPHLSHFYHLEFDSSEGQTKVQEKYFWKHRHSELITNAT